MSGISSIFNRNGKPVDREIDNTMLDGISYRQPDDRGLLLIYVSFWNKYRLS